MSYEQKYLKYKQKYQELKRQLHGGAHNLETETYNEMPDFSLTDTPTEKYFSDNQRGGNDVETEMDYALSDTPTERVEYRGGAPLVMADYTTGVPLATCAGQVNPMPNVQVPLPVSNIAAVAPTAAVVAPPMVGGNDEEINTTTDLSEIQNTEDIAKLFGQFGGKHSTSSSSSSSSGSDSDFSDSDSF
jgi:hypothetical protein